MVFPDAKLGEGSGRADAIRIAGPTKNFSGCLDAAVAMSAKVDGTETEVVRRR